VERKGEARQGAGGRNRQESELERVSRVQKAGQVEMGGALLSGGHQSSSPFIVGFAGVILAQEGLRRAKLLSRMMNTKHSAPYGRTRFEETNCLKFVIAAEESRKIQ